MKHLFAAVLLLAAATAAVAQTATVVELSKCDAEQAKQLYEAKQKADAEWDKFSAEIGKKHKLYNFEFSKDFRFIVPTIPTITPFTCSNWNCGNIMLTPATPPSGSWVTPATGNITFDSVVHN